MPTKPGHEGAGPDRWVWACVGAYTWAGVDVWYLFRRSLMNAAQPVNAISRRSDVDTAISYHEVLPYGLWYACSRGQYQSFVKCGFLHSFNYFFHLFSLAYSQESIRFFPLILPAPQPLHIPSVLSPCCLQSTRFKITIRLAIASSSTYPCEHTAIDHQWQPRFERSDTGQAKGINPPPARVLVTDLLRVAAWG